MILQILCEYSLVQQKHKKGEVMIWISIEELASELCLSKRTLQNRLSDGSSMPPSYKLGKRRMFLRSEVDTWILNSRVGSSIKKEVDNEFK